MCVSVTQSHDFSFLFINRPNLTMDKIKYTKLIKDKLKKNSSKKYDILSTYEN